MADILDIIVQFFGISQDLVSKHANEGPIAQMFYLLFFPTIFVLIFIYLITARGLFKEHRAFRILVSVAIYAFIILSGYYTYFVMFSEYWLFGLVILGALYMFWYRGGTRIETGKTGGAQPKGVGSKIMSQFGQRMKKEVTHELDDRVKMIDGMLDQLEDALGKASGNIEDIDNILGGGGGAMMMLTRIYQMIMDMRNDESVMGFKINAKRFEHLIKRYNIVAHRLGGKTIHT